MKKILLSLIVWACVYGFAQPTPVAPSGAGTELSPYEISSLANLYWISQNSTEWIAGKYYTQTVDITATDMHTWDSNQGWLPIGTTADRFQGHYDGNNKKITGLRINRPSTANVGLFGHIGQNSGATVIKNLQLDDVQVIGGRGSGTLIGRVTGNAETLIENCSAINGFVRGGNGAVGGLIGSNNSHRETPGGTDNPVVRYCYANITVSSHLGSEIAKDKFGGLAGCNQKGTIINSYARGSVGVTNAINVGGLAGCILFRGTVVNSYSTGAVGGHNNTQVGGLVGNVGSGGNAGTITASFWDTQTSGQSSSAGGTGQTTENMQKEETFTNAGWDFDTVWAISAGVNNGYPNLNLRSPRPTDAVWDGGSAVDSNTMTEENWVGDRYPAPGNSSVMRFDGDVRTSVNVNYDADTHFGIILFRTGADAFTLSGNRLQMHTLLQNDSPNTQTLAINLILAGALEVNATNASGTTVLSGILSGSKSLTKTGDGTLILTGNNTYSGATTNSAGTLQIGNGGTSGFVADTIVNNADFIFYREDSVTYEGVFAGESSGTFIKKGPGVLRMTAANNTYAGATEVQAGALGGKGLPQSDVIIKDGAKIKPGVGSGIDTLQTADLTLEAGSIYICDISTPEMRDVIQVNGALNLPIDEGTITIRITSGADLTINTTYAVMTYDTLGSGGADNIVVDDQSDFAYDILVEVDAENKLVLLHTLPEPGLLGVVMLGAYALTRRRRDSGSE